MTRLILALVPALLLATAPALAADAPGAKPAAKVLKAPRAPVADGKARVAQGTIVAHYGSAWRPAEIAALRPGYADLRPRARTNQE